MKHARKIPLICKAGIPKTAALALAVCLLAGCAEKETGQTLPESGSGQTESIAEEAGQNKKSEAGQVNNPAKETAVPEFETAQEAVEKMILGWNVGNALDSNGPHITGEVSEWETAWGSSVITPDLIKAMKEAGFEVIRVPVSWLDHMDEQYQVDQAWMERVEEVVNYCLNEDLYCILNVHHDCGASDAAWLRADMENIEEIEERFSALWLQISERFGKYDERLIFEGYNEMLDKNSQWSNTDEDGYKALNRLAQVFVDTVRGTGGNNAVRNLIVNTYSAGPGELSVGSLEIPEDPAENHLMAEVHVYAPGRFTTDADWIQDSTAEFDAEAEKELDEIFARLEEHFIRKGIPAVIGEFGAQDKDNDEQRARYANYFMRKAREYGISCIWWDDCGNMSLIDRRGPLWTQPGIRNGLTAGRNGEAEFTMETVSQEELQALNAFEEPEYSGTMLEEKNWKIETYANQEAAASLTDGDVTTAWANLEEQIPDTEDQWIKIDLGSRRELNRIMLWTPNRDYTREYEVYGSEDGENWELLAEGEGKREYLNIDFETVSARYIRINQTGEASTNYWSIYEIRMYCLD